MTASGGWSVTKLPPAMPRMTTSAMSDPSPLHASQIKYIRTKTTLPSMCELYGPIRSASTVGEHIAPDSRIRDGRAAQVVSDVDMAGKGCRRRREGRGQELTSGAEPADDGRCVLNDASLVSSHLIHRALAGVEVQTYSRYGAIVPRPASWPYVPMNVRYAKKPYPMNCPPSASSRRLAGREQHCLSSSGWSRPSGNKRGTGTHEKVEHRHCVLRILERLQVKE